MRVQLGIGGRHVRTNAVAVWVGVVVLALPAIAAAQLNAGSSVRARDGTVYQVLALDQGALFGDVEAFQITNVAGSIDGLQTCNAGGGAGMTTTGSAGAVTAVNQVLHPPILRSGIINATVDTIEFVSVGAGRLRVGTGPNQVEICRVASECANGPPDAPTFAITDAGGGVPKACVAHNVSTPNCSLLFDTISFNVAGNGDCLPPSTSGTVCDPPPADGFTLTQGQLVVFIYDDSLGMSGFTLGVGGLGINLTGPASGCMNSADIVRTSFAAVPSAPAAFPVGPLNIAPALSLYGLGATAVLLALAGLRRVIRR